MFRRPPRPPPFPYTTLFRSVEIALAREPPADDEVGLFGVANVLLRRWTLVAGLPLLAALLAGAVSLLVPPTFTATTSFVPEVDRKSTRLNSSHITISYAVFC